MSDRPMLLHVGFGMYATPPISEYARNEVRRSYRSSRRGLGADRHDARNAAQAALLVIGLCELARNDHEWDARQKRGAA